MPIEVEPLTESDAIELTYRAAITAALEDELDEDPNVLVMGEDVASSGGVFKTTEGLVERFGRARVRNTPICENTFVGVALGMAITGLRPVVEIMFSDFLPMAGDAIVNELAKFRFMSGGQCSVPVTVRSIGGATGRFGAQHSATGESWYMQFPGIKVATASSPASAYGVLRASIRDNNPVIFFEHKGLYATKGPVTRDRSAIARVGQAELTRTGTDVTLIGTMLMAARGLEAARQVAEAGEIDTEVLDLRWLRPLDIDAIERSVRKTGRLVIVEEQVHAGGWGATVISHLSRRGVVLKRPPMTVSLSEGMLIPYAPPLEDALVPRVAQIAAALRTVVNK
jgi:pyruvate dehydrogenase E1 component beta subunit